MIFNYFIIFACALTVYSKNLPENNTAIISTYAKVAHWGAVSSTTTDNSQSEGRSHNGQTLWTHRSDVNIIGGQNLKTNKPKVVYHYAQKVGQNQKESMPGVGEVQERFNPRPYFDYQQVPSKYQNTKSESKPKTKSESTQSPTFDSFPVFNQPAPPPSSPDLYSSQYSSYNPPNAGPVATPDDSTPDVAYPPNAPPPPSDADGSSDDSNGYGYNPPQDSHSPPEGPPAPAYPTLGPPLAPNHHDQKEQFYYPPAEEDNNNNHHDAKHQIHYPHDHKEQLYYPPAEDGNHHETILDHPPPGWQENKPDMGAAPDMGDMGDMNGGMNGMNGAMNGMNGGMNGMSGNGGHDMAEHDLSPPPASDFSGHFPNYLYNGPHDNDQGHNLDYDFDHHHVYKEVTTTTEAPEDERVNKGHYSYYYLGRKLWYIPLYFSVYFILYVTVLILKSIARHKIQFKHEHFVAKDMAKEMEHHGRSLNLDELQENVTTAIDTSRRKFTYVAM